MRKIIVVFLLLLICSWTHAASYYVDATGGNDSNDGLSSGAAWKTIANVNSKSFSPGDFILFKRGESWSERLVVSSSGSSGNRITFGAYGSGANPSIREIYASSKSYIIVKNITVKNSSNGEAGILIVDNSDYITIDNCIVEDNADNGISFWCPYYGNNLVITNSVIRNNGSDGSSNNGIFIKGTSGTISGCTVYNNGWGDSAWGYSHGIYIDDGAASFDIYENIIHGNDRGMDITSKCSSNIYRNLIYDNKYGIQIGENGINNVTNNVYSNIFYGNEQGIWEQTKGTGDITLSIYNNSFYKSTSSAWTAEILIEDDLTSLTIKNNAIYAQDSEDAYKIVTQTNATIDYNCVYRANAGDFITYGGSSRTWSYWQDTLGFDVNGINSDPKYSNPSTHDFHLQSASPAIDAGTASGAPSTDYDGVSIPQVSGYDIGAYEYGGAPPAPDATPPTPPHHYIPMEP